MNETPRPKYLLNLALFVLTCLTTTAQGAMEAHGGPIGPIFPLRDGLSYSVPLMAILVCHELGHYFAARAHGVPASLPFFIPIPPRIGPVQIGLLGTMGAVIVQSHTTDRKKLIDIGAAGPLAGLAVAIPVLYYGLTLSEVKPLLDGGGMQEGNSILYAILKRLATGEWLPNGARDVTLHPTAWAGWAGLLVTMLNLLPIGQLDGGHIATAYFGNRYERVAPRLHAAIPALALGVMAAVYVMTRRDLAVLGPDAFPGAVFAGTYSGFIWVVWFGMLFLMRRLSGGQYHPPVSSQPLPRSRRVLFWVACVSYVLIFMPVPLRIKAGIVDKSARPAAAAPAR